MAGYAGVATSVSLYGTNLRAPGTRFYARCGGKSYPLVVEADAEALPQPGSGASPGQGQDPDGASSSSISSGSAAAARGVASARACLERVVVRLPALPAQGLVAVEGAAGDRPTVVGGWSPLVVCGDRGVASELEGWCDAAASSSSWRRCV